MKLHNSSYYSLISIVAIVIFVVITKWVSDVFDNTLISFSELFKICITPSIITSVLFYKKYKKKIGEHVFGAIVPIAVIFFGIIIFGSIFLVANYIKINPRITQEEVEILGTNIRGRRGKQLYFIVPYKDKTIEIPYYGDKNELDTYSTVLLTKRKGLFGYEIIMKKDASI